MELAKYKCEVCPHKQKWTKIEQFESMPQCCGYPVLLTVENKFGQRSICKAFTNYMEDGKFHFLTNEKEYCSELTSSDLSNAWKPIAWMPLPEPYKEGEEDG